MKRTTIWLVLVLPWMLLLTGCLKHELQSGLNQQEAQEIIVLLKGHGLEASSDPIPNGKETPTWTVQVLGGNQNLVLAWRVLQENGLPRQRVKGLEEVFSTSGLIPTASEEKAKMLMGLTGEITKTLNSVDGIVDARVHVVLPENSPLVDRAQWSATTASVLIKYRGNKIPLEESEVKALVSKGVEGLSPDQVVVVYKSIPEMQNPARDVKFYLGNQELTLAAVSLMCLLGMLAVGLSARVRQLKKRIKTMQRDEINREAAVARG